MATFVNVAGSEQPIPKVNFNPGPVYADANRRFGICSSIGRTPGGRLWCGFSSGGEGEGHLNYGVVVTSDDDGASWSAPHIVFDTDGDGPIRTDHVVIFPAPDGVLWILWNQYATNLCGPLSSLWAMTCQNPDEPTPQWSPPRKLVDEQNCLNKPTVLGDGSWIFPTGSWQRGQENASRPLLSSDHGRTFELGGRLTAEPRPDFDEYMIVERRDGGLLLYNRHPTSILSSYSLDRGRSWSKQQVTGIRHTNARFVFARLPSGAWLLVKHGGLDWISENHESKHPANLGRSHLTAFVSDDEGESWQGGLLLEERPCSYPDAWIAPDGRIYLSYERSRWDHPEILLATFREADVRAGCLLSPDAHLQRLINRAGT